MKAVDTSMPPKLALTRARAQGAEAPPPADEVPLKRDGTGPMIHPQRNQVMPLMDDVAIDRSREQLVNPPIPQPAQPMYAHAPLPSNPEQVGEAAAAKEAMLLARGQHLAENPPLDDTPMMDPVPDVPIREYPPLHETPSMPMAPTAAPAPTPMMMMAGATPTERQVLAMVSAGVAAMGAYMMAKGGSS